jgi:hypothetical protein
VTSTQASNGLTWAALGTFLLTLVLAIIQMSSAAGKTEAEVQDLKRSAPSWVTKAEWQEFTLDTRDRLDRIESKLDAHVAAEGRTH